MADALTEPLTKQMKKQPTSTITSVPDDDESLNTDENSLMRDNLDIPDEQIADILTQAENESKGIAVQKIP